MASQAHESPLGMEEDPLENLDREEARAIAQAVKVRRDGGDVSGIMRALDALASDRLKLIAAQRRHAA
jgi:hypothetical protein